MRSRLGKSISVSHLLYDDNDMVVYGPNQLKLRYLGNFHEAVSGIRTNFNRSIVTFLIGSVLNSMRI